MVFRHLHVSQQVEDLVKKCSSESFVKTTFTRFLHTKDDIGVFVCRQFLVEITNPLGLLLEIYFNEKNVITLTVTYTSEHGFVLAKISRQFDYDNVVVELL